MTIRSTITRGLRCAVLLGTGRPEAIALIENEPAAVIGSFWAIPLCLPALLLIGLSDWRRAMPTDGQMFMRNGGFAAVFLVSWLAFMVISHAVTGLLGNRALWPRFIAVWAWCGVMENSAIAIAYLPDLLHLPAIMGQVLFLVALGWAWWLEWYATRLTLKVGGWTAVAFVVIDILIGLILTTIGSALG